MQGSRLAASDWSQAECIIARVLAPTRLLFVCYGNIVRSPLAEALFRRLVASSGAEERYAVDSAGTSGAHDGQPPHPTTQRVAEAHGLHLKARSRRVQVEDFDRFDWMLALDGDVASDLEALARSSRHQDKIRLLRRFDPLASDQASIPDPIRAGSDAFEMTYEIIERSVRGLFTALEAGQI
ncbi:MAG: low molecular weight protein-tyrosine-phosphatase [Chloroflexota bacterium]